jgi:hypothetical protein
MRIRGIVWLREIVDKLAVKHHVEPHEVEEARRHVAEVSSTLSVK